MAVKTAGVGHFLTPTAPAAGTAVAQSGSANTYGTKTNIGGTSLGALYITGVYVEVIAAANLPTYVGVQLYVTASTVIDTMNVPLGPTSGVAATQWAVYKPIYPPVPVAASTQILAATASSVASAISYLVTLECILATNYVDDGVAVGTVTTVTNQLTAAQVATGIWQDTTAGDFTTALSVGKSLMNGVALGTGLTVNTVTNQLTAAQVATGIWQDTTAGDFTTALSVGKSVMNGVALGTGLTVNTVTNQLTAAQVATGVWQDATSGDFTTASSIGKALYIANVAPGAAGGHFIAGTNAATSITTALTANIVGNITGNLSGSVGSVTGQLTAAQIATGIWQDTTAGDFTASLSVGKSLMNGVTLGTGLTVAAVSGAVGSVTGLTASNLDATVSSRMATYTQPTGFLSATFPGTVASTTNITAGTITTVGTLTTYTGNTPQTGDGFARIGLAGAGLTALGDTRIANLDATVSSRSTYAGGAVASVSGNVTGSVGSVVGAVGSVTGLTASNLDTTVSSRMATYSQPSGFLAATFPATIASSTNITGGTITTVTNLTNAPTVGDLTTAMKSSVTTAATAATPTVGSVAGSVGSVVATVDANIKSVNNITVNGSGSPGTPWGP